MRNRDIDLCYKDEGEQSLPPAQMHENMYLVARSMMNRGVKQDCILREGDVIKVGRVKFKVQVIHVQEKEKEREKRKLKMQLRKAMWEIKEKQAAIEKAKNKFYKKTSLSGPIQLVDRYEKSRERKKTPIKFLESRDFN
jgi:hypothetical protein